jgi:hypothetical protein
MSKLRTYLFVICTISVLIIIISFNNGLVLPIFTKSNVTLFSFEEGDRAWNESILLYEHNPHQTIHIKSEYIDKPIEFEFDIHKLEGENKKLTAAFTFSNKNGKKIGKYVLVLKGEQDYYNPNNRVQDDYLWVTNVLSSNIIKKTGAIKVDNLLQQFNDSSRTIIGKELIKENIHKVTLTLSIWSSSDKDNIATFTGFRGFLDDNDLSSIKKLDKKSVLSEKDSILLASNYFPSDGQKYLQIESDNKYETSVCIEHKFKNNKRYQISVDSRVIIASDPAKFLIIIDDKIIEPIKTAPVYMQQNGWTRSMIEFDVNSIDNNGLLCLFSSPFSDTNANRTSRGIYNYDNVTIDDLGKAQGKQNIESYNKVDFFQTITNNEKQQIDVELDSLGIPIYDLTFDETIFWNKSDIKSKDMIPAVFKIGKKEYKVKIRVRGLNPWHSYTPIKSWRVKFNKENRFDGKESINLIRPVTRGIIGESNSYYIAKKLNLIELENKFIFLRINGVPYGLMFEIEQWNGGILEKNERVNGDIYGDEAACINLGWMITTLECKKKYAFTEYLDKDNKENISLLIDMANLGFATGEWGPMNHLIDVDKFIKWSVHSYLIGSDHQNDLNNIRLYYNSAKGSFEIIPWDSKGRVDVFGKYGVDSSAKLYDQNLYSESFTIMRWLLASNHEIFEKRNKLLWSYLNDNSSLIDDISHYKNTHKTIRDALSASRHYELHKGSRTVNAKNVENYLLSVPKMLLSYRQELREVLEKSSQYIQVDLISPNPSYKTKNFEIKITARDNLQLSSTRVNEVSFTQCDEIINITKSYVNRSIVDHNNSKFIENIGILKSKKYLNLVKLPEGSSIYKGVDNNITIKIEASNIVNLNELKDCLEVTGINSTTGKLIETNIDLLNSNEAPQVVVNRNGMVSDNNSIYEIIKGGLWRKYKLTTYGMLNDIEPSFIEVNPDKYHNGSYKYFADVFLSKHEFLDKYKKIFNMTDEDNSIVISPGTYVIDQKIIVPKNVKFIISPGVELLMKRDASIVSYGDVVAKGSKNFPIKIRAYNNEPWGVIAIIGPSKKAIFEYVEISGGNSDLINGVFFSGMLSAYNSDLYLDHSVMSSANLISGDDSLNVKYGNADINNTIFQQNNGDAIDIDFSKGSSTIVNTRIVDTNNDGIDVSGTALSIASVNIYACGDKGVSAGERSNVSIHSLEVSECDFAVVGKDLSMVDINSSSFFNNYIGIAAYNKKQIFGGAQVVVNESKIFDNNQNYALQLLNENGSPLTNNMLSNIYLYDTAALFTNSRKTMIIKEAKVKNASKKKLMKAYLKGELYKYTPKSVVLHDIAEKIK